MVTVKNAMGKRRKQMFDIGCPPYFINHDPNEILLKLSCNEYFY